MGVSGGTDRSYGIQVARLAGLPSEVIARARDLLRQFEQGAPTPEAPADAGQLALFAGPGARPVAEPGPTEPVASAPHPVLDALRALDPDRMTPLEALTAIHELRRRLTDEA